MKTIFINDYTTNSQQKSRRTKHDPPPTRSFTVNNKKNKNKTATNMLQLSSSFYLVVIFIVVTVADLHHTTSQILISVSAISQKSVGGWSVDNEQQQQQQQLIAQQWDEMLFNESNPSSVRSICNRLDNKTLMLEYEKDSDPSLLQDCLAALEATTMMQKTTTGHQLPTPPPCQTPTLFHAFWSGTLLLNARLGLLSTVYNQPRGCVELHLWTTNKDHQQEYRKALEPYMSQQYLHVRSLNGTQLATDIGQVFPTLQPLLQQHSQNLFGQLNDPNPNGLTPFSDGIRFLVLAAYGGVYVDADVLVLRSFQPLLSSGRDFIYRWSFQDYPNTAVMSLRHGSDNARSILHNILTTQPAVSMRSFSSAVHPFGVLRLVQSFNGTVEMLPSAYFDPSWVAMDGYVIGRNWTGQEFGLETPTEFFQTPTAPVSKLKNIKSFFPGAFAYHWHNKWMTEQEHDSVAAVFAAHFEQIRKSGEYVMDEKTTKTTPESGSMNKPYVKVV
jgi:Glycosyltransferase sugar-binding region containing DXD motif